MLAQCRELSFYLNGRRLLYGRREDKFNRGGDIDFSRCFAGHVIKIYMDVRKTV